MERREEDPAAGVVAAAYRSLGERLAERLAEESSGESSSTTRRGIPFMGTVLVWIVLLLESLWLIGPVLLVWRVGPSVGTGLVLVLCWWAFSSTCPRPPKEPWSAVSIPTPPHVQGLVDRVAATLGTQSPRATFDATFGAATWRLGLTRRQLRVSLGIPLMAFLDPQERVAIIAHEVGHQVNGDPTRALPFVWAAFVLRSWIEILTPRPRIYSRAAAFQSLADSIMRGMRWLAAAYLIAMYHPFLQGARRAEHQADVLARHVAGTAATRSSLEALRFVDTFWFLVDMEARHPSRAGSLWAEMAARRDRAGWSEPSVEPRELDASHPPLDLRLRVVGSVEVQPAIRMTAEEIEAFDETLREHRDAVEKALVSVRSSQLG